LKKAIWSAGIKLSGAAATAATICPRFAGFQKKSEKLLFEQKAFDLFDLFFQIVKLLIIR
jgi:hypothetical protein